MFQIRKARFWIGLGISLAFMLLLVWTIDLQQIVVELRKANYLFLIPAILLYFISIYFRSIRWKHLLSPVATISISKLYPVIIIGYMANNLLPVRLGELVRAYYLSRREDVSGTASLASIAVERVFDGITLLIFCFTAVPILYFLGAFDATSELHRASAILFAFLSLGLFGLSLVLFNFMASNKFDNVSPYFLRFIPVRFKPHASTLIQQFSQGLATLRSIRSQMKIVLLSLPVWLTECGVYASVAYGFGIPEYFESQLMFLTAILLVTATSNLVTAIPSSIGGIGPFEVVAQQTLVALGLNASLGATYSGFVHIIALWLPVNIVGIILVWSHNLSLSKLADLAKPGNTIQNEPANTNQNEHPGVQL